MNTTELVLSYIGAMLIAIEFVRKFTDFQALIGMLAGWPLSSLLKENQLEDITEIIQQHKLVFALRISLSILLCVLTLPLTVTLYLIWFVILFLNSFHNWINTVYFEGKKRYRNFYMLMI